MKDLIDSLLKYLPNYVVIAALTAMISFFGVYYSKRYSSHYHVIWDKSFINIIILIGTATLLYANNREISIQNASGRPPLVIVPLFLNDADDQCRSPFIAHLGSKLDKRFGRTDSVKELDSFVNDERTAKQMIDRRGAQAIIYQASVSRLGESNVLCFKILQSGSGSLPRLPPVPISNLEESLDGILDAIGGHLAADGVAGESNPLRARIDRVERNMEEIRSLINRSEAARRSKKVRPSYSAKRAIVVGLDSLAGSSFKLRYAEKDANDLTTLLHDRLGFEVQSLRGALATRSSILKSLKQASKHAGPDDLFVFYFSGNLVVIPDGDSGGKVGSLVPYDFDQASRTLTLHELREAVEKIPVRHKVILVDSCHATAGLSNLAIAPTASEDANQPAFQYFGACSADQVAREGEEWGGGAFTQTIIRVLEDSSRNSEGGIWMQDLFARVRSHIAQNITDQNPELFTFAGSGEIFWEAAGNPEEVGIGR